MNTKLLEKVRADFSQFDFLEGDDFRWSPSRNAIFFKTDSNNFEISLLHEVGHALSNHRDFSKDIDLVKMELEAWECAKNIAKNYGIKIPQRKIEDHLDTYRDWLHRRSLCPNCSINGFQRSNSSYLCPSCHSSWKANDSRFMELRRFREK